MRIAHVITRMIIGGAQENTLWTCEDLIQQHGDEVLLVTGPALGPEGDLLAGERAKRVPWVVIPSLRRAIHPLRDWQSYRHLWQVLRDFRPEVVHTHSAKGGILGRLAASSLRVPVIVHTVHGAPFHAFQSRLARDLACWCERQAARRCHALISVADAMTDQLTAAGVAPREKFTTIYSGMDVEPFLRADEQRRRVRETCGFRDEHVVIGKIARLFPLKGHEYLISAAAQVVQRAPHVRFLFVGDGVLRAELQRRIVAQGLENHLFFTGLVDPRQIPDYVGAMDVLVHCSLREGLARALPQALLAGKPVVSYDIDGAKEVVQDGETGYLLPPLSIEPLAERLVQLAGQPELRQRLGATGRARCEQPFRHEYMTSRIRELYLQLAESRRAR